MNPSQRKFNTEPDLDILENYDIIFDEIQVHLEDTFSSVSGIIVKQIALVGSRVIGNYSSNSDIDILVEYSGILSEEELTIILNSSPLFFEEYRIDYIPLQIGRYGPGNSSLDIWLEQHNEYADVEVNRMLL